MKWATTSYCESEPGLGRCFILNHYVRAWGHRFIFDEPTLRHLLTFTGFTELSRVLVGQSTHVELKGLENSKRMPPGFLALESLVLEARRPA